MRPLVSRNRRTQLATPPSSSERLRRPLVQAAHRPHPSHRRGRHATAKQAAAQLAAARQPTETAVQQAVAQQQDQQCTQLDMQKGLMAEKNNQRYEALAAEEAHQRKVALVVEEAPQQKEAAESAR